MQRLAFAVPEPVLTGHARRALAKATAAAGGLWLSAETVLAAPDIAKTSSDPAAHPKRAAQENAARAPKDQALSQPPLWPLAVPQDEVFWPLVSGDGAAFLRGPRGRAMLTLTPGVNGGYGDLEPLRRLDHFTAAVIWAPGDIPAKTLLTLRGETRSANYLFLSEEAPGELLLRDNDGGLRLESQLLRREGQDWAAAMISVTGNTVTFALPGQAPLTGEGLINLPQRGRLMLGCRAAREGMPKSLGAARISDLFYWPGLDVLGGDGASTGATQLPLRGAKPDDGAGPNPRSAAAEHPDVVDDCADVPPGAAETSAQKPLSAAEHGAKVRAAFDTFCLWEL